MVKYGNFLGAVTNIPETTFNNMHGKIADLNTEDAQKLSRNHLNEIGEHNWKSRELETKIKLLPLFRSSQIELFWKLECQRCLGVWLLGA